MSSIYKFSSMNSHQLSPEVIKLRSNLIIANSKKPFNPIEHQNNAKRAGLVAAKLGLEHLVVRGNLVVRNAEATSHWLAIRIGDKIAVIDPSMPLKTQEGEELAVRYFAGDIDGKYFDFKTHGEGMGSRILEGVYPDDVEYFGVPNVMRSREFSDFFENDNFQAA